MSDDLIKCEVCEALMSAITAKHLARHNMILANYKQLYPNSPTRSNSTILRKQAAAKQVNASRKGIPRTDEVKQKISKTKKNNPTEAWNKGIPRTPEQKQHASQKQIDNYKMGKLVHWNLGKQHSDETKQKISNTSKSQNRTYSDISKLKRYHTYQKKKAIGWVHHSTINKGKSLKLSTKSYERVIAAQRKNNKLKQQRKQIRIRQHLQQYNIRVLQYINRNTVMLQCDVCNNTFTRTDSVLAPYNYELYKGEYCPICFPFATGYYKYNTFIQRPSLVNISAVLYLIEFTNSHEHFCKIGITTRNLKNRFKASKYTITTALEYQTTLFNAYSIEQQCINKFKNFKYQPLINFGGHTECFSLDALPLIQQEIQQSF